MKRLLILFLLASASLSAQSIAACRQRFTEYLNYRGKLSGVVQFDDKAIYILNAQGHKELAIYEEELPVLAAYLENTSNKSHQKLFAAKGLRRFSKAQLDSLATLYRPKQGQLSKNKDLPFKDLRIAIDPGHFGTNLKEAAAEQKYMYFANPGAGGKADTVKLFESKLTFNTAKLLQKMLEEKGATVMLTRQQEDHTSFDCSFTYWMQHRRKHTLDSMLAIGKMAQARYNKLLKCGAHELFWDFFRDYDLMNRVEKINRFSPHATLIVHYNVDEKNAPWKKTSDKNFTMTFIGGAMMASDIEKPESRADFLRMLLSSQLTRSEELAAQTTRNFNKNLGIPIAKASDAEYLAKSCNATSSAGVYCRNLALCRRINSALVYGEALYQDNAQECRQLMRLDVESFGNQTNARLVSVAKSYYDAVFSFFKTND